MYLNISNSFLRLKSGNNNLNIAYINIELKIDILLVFNNNLFL